MQKNKDCCNLRGNLCALLNSATKNTHMTKRKNILYIFSFLIGVFFLLSSATPVFALGERYKEAETLAGCPIVNQKITEINTLFRNAQRLYSTLNNSTSKAHEATKAFIPIIKNNSKELLLFDFQPSLMSCVGGTNIKAFEFEKNQLDQSYEILQEIQDNFSRLSGDTCGNFVLQGNEVCESFTFVINGKNYSQTKFFYNDAVHKSQENDCGALDSTKEFGRIRCVDCFIVKDQCSDKPITTQAAEEPLVIEEYQSLLGTIRVSQMSDPAKVIGKAIKLIMRITGSITLVLFVFSGIMWMTAAGNAEREKKAMDMIFWTSAGVIVILTSYIIVTFIFENVF